ncbi:MAG: hypothetical protein K0R21_337 [Anaerocolumna sp.]|jgi:hypothetical protein|nr:hypothetical protein [Anaerocolumna sp.]
MELLYGMLGFCIVIILGVIKEQKDALNNKNKAAGHCIVNKISEMLYPKVNSHLDIL